MNSWCHPRGGWTLLTWLSRPIKCRFFLSIVQKLIEWKICILLYITAYFAIVIQNFVSKSISGWFFIPLSGFAGFCKVPFIEIILVVKVWHFIATWGDNALNIYNIWSASNLLCVIKLPKFLHNQLDAWITFHIFPLSPKPFRRYSVLKTACFFGLCQNGAPYFHLSYNDCN